MANGQLLRKLIKSGASGDKVSFRAASEEMIKEEREKHHHLLANDLERLLYGNHVVSTDKSYRLHILNNMPTSKDNGLELLEERIASRNELDIVLSDKTQSAVDEILMEHNRSDVLRSYGMQPAQKLLFCGPPGCGKTLAAEVMANNLCLPLVLVRLDSVISSFLGETASNLRKIFDYVSAQPAVALFDEFDALAKDRGDNADHGELKRAVNAVLQMMDSYQGSSILIATTNYEALLDHAVWRRFDETIHFELPTQKEIKRLLALKLSSVHKEFDASSDEISSQFEGMSYADIERILRRAVKDMILSKKDCLEKKHLDQAFSREYHHQ